MLMDCDVMISQILCSMYLYLVECVRHMCHDVCSYVYISYTCMVHPTLCTELKLTYAALASVVNIYGQIHSAPPLSPLVVSIKVNHSKNGSQCWLEFSFDLQRPRCALHLESY